MSTSEVLTGARDWWIECADVMAGLAQIPDGAVQCCVTSPPYFGLRDYGTTTWAGGDPDCDHKKVHSSVGVDDPTSTLTGRHANTNHQQEGFRGDCRRCGAIRVDRQLGLESSPDDYLAKMVAVFREVRRVLRPDGVLWLNVGDGYAANRTYQVRDNKHTDVGNVHGSRVPDGLKPKDLMGMPWRLALALQADGWWLRSDVIWSKPNPMPESVDDRPTRSHEYLFLLTKSARYFYDAEAVREPHCDRAGGPERFGNIGINGGYQHHDYEDALARPTFPQARGGRVYHPGGRNCRSVWEIPTEAFTGAHFATFPTALVERCVKAGTSECGCCPRCGAPWRRLREPTPAYAEKLTAADHNWYARVTTRGPREQDGCKGGNHQRRIHSEYLTTGWTPTCACDAGEPRPCLILDPFAGAGTTLLVARRLGRRAIGIDLSEFYCRMACDRIIADQGLEPERADEAAGPAQLRMLG